MAKTAKKGNNSNLLKLLVGGSVLLFILMKATESQPVVRKKGAGAPPLSTSTKKKKDDFKAEDYVAEFASLSETTKNSFKPVISSKKADSKLVTVAINGIPPLFANGDPNWIYTGNMEVDGVPNALLENTSTGEGVFLRPKEKWRQLVLREVAKDSVVLEGPNGYIKTVYVLTAEVEVVNPAKVVTGTVQTLPPAGSFPGGRVAENGLSGPIGSTQAVIGDPAMMVDGTFPSDRRGGKGRRNR